MAIAFVQDDVSTNGASPATVTLASNVTAGNLIVVGMFGQTTSGTTPTMTDGLGNTYVVRGATDLNIGRLWIYTAENINAGACTVTITQATVIFDAIVAAEYSGLATSSSTDQTAATTGNGTAVSFATGTTTQADELVVAFLTSVAGVFTAPGSGFTERQNFGFLRAHLYQDKIVSAIGAQTIDATNSAGDWGGVGVTIKAVGSGQRFFALSRF